MLLGTQAQDDDPPVNGWIVAPSCADERSKITCRLSPVERNLPLAVRQRPGRKAAKAPCQRGQSSLGRLAEAAQEFRTFRVSI